MTAALPEGWDVAPIGSVARVVGGGTPPSHDPDNFAPTGDGIPWVTPADLSGYRSQSISRGARDLSETGLARCGATLMPKGTVLFSSRAPIGYVAIAANEISTNQGFKSFVLPAEIDPRFAYWQLKHLKPEAEAIATGTTFKELSGAAAATLPFRIAPLPEQTRIADQLDTLLARIQACQDRLEAIPVLLKRFRQAVLRAATSGELTRDERSRCDWSSDWTPMPLTALGELARGKSKHRPRNDPRLYGGPYPFVQTGDVAQSGGLIIQHRQTYSELGLQQSRLWPAGTLCITIAANIADTALLTYPACFPDSVVGFIANPKKCEALFVKWSIDVVKDDIEALAPATAQKNINLSVLNEVVIRTPDLAEQREIVRQGKALLAIADRIETRYVDALRHSQRLAPLTLAKAFRGELVPQDPNDEPASALLARIAAQRNAPASVAVAPTPRRGRPPRAPKETATMTKSRQDDDVMGQPYLAWHLRRIGTPASAEALFKVADLPLADFYKQLAWEVAQGHVKDNQTTLEPGHAAG
ncbi:MAG: restriction endonuclease subunit S [Burkholderiales bacterium]|nr:restriction endonuclease subunit S [Burkholderiales bacterium]